MARQNRQAEVTAELLKLSLQQATALQDATFLGWNPERLDAFQERGDRVVLLRRELAILMGAVRPASEHAVKVKPLGH